MQLTIACYMNTKTITINIFEVDEGYQYDIYKNTDLSELDGADPIDGGLCTTTIENALNMATEQTSKLINIK